MDSLIDSMLELAEEASSLEIRNDDGRRALEVALGESVVSVPCSSPAFFRHVLARGAVRFAGSDDGVALYGFSASTPVLDVRVTNSTRDGFFFSAKRRA